MKMYIKIMSIVLMSACFAHIDAAGLVLLYDGDKTLNGKDLWIHFTATIIPGADCNTIQQDINLNTIGSSKIFNHNWPMCTLKMVEYEIDTNAERRSNFGGVTIDTMENPTTVTSYNQLFGWRVKIIHGKSKDLYTDQWFLEWH